MAIYRNVAGQKLAVMAFNTTDGTLVTGDALNITGQICLDGVTSSPTNDVNPVEPLEQTGMYVFELTQAETNSELILLTASSTTSDVQLEPVQVLTVDPADFKSDVSALATQSSVNTIASDVSDIDSKVDSLDIAITSIEEDTNELQTNQNNWLTATGFSTHSATDVRNSLQAVADDFKATGFSTFDPALDVVAHVTLVDTSTDVTNQTSGTSPDAVYDYFVDGNRADAFKSDVSSLATSSALSAIATTGGPGPWTTGSGGGGSSVTYVGYVPCRTDSTDLTVYQGETYAASIEPRDSSGTAVNLASKTMYVVIENEDTAVDAVVINDADLTKTATTIGFTIDTVVTNVDNPSHLWALRDASTNEVYMHGTLYVDKVATQG